MLKGKNLLEMRLSCLKVGVLAGLAAVVNGQRPMNESICDYYTTALLMNNTAANQATLLTLLVNTVVIGNYTMPNHNAVPGILAAGEYDGTPVDLLQYFNGTSGATTNRNGTATAGVNFLDGGGAAPLEMNMAANDTTSNQYRLVTHLYQFFGTLLGCTMQGMGNAFPAYSGDPSMYAVHQYMGLGPNENGYFITQVGLAAASFGVATSDILAVAMALNNTFNNRCSPPAAVIPGTMPMLQSICITDSCPLAPMAVCADYNGTSSSSSASSSGGSSSTAAASGTAAAGGSASSTAAAGGGAAGGSSTASAAASPKASDGNAVGVGKATAAMMAVWVAAGALMLC